MNKENRYDSEFLETFQTLEQFITFCQNDEGFGLDLKYSQEDFKIIFEGIQEGKVFVLGASGILEEGTKFDLEYEEEELEKFKEHYASKFKSSFQTTVHFITNEYALQVYYQTFQGNKRVLNHSSYEFDL